MNRKFLLFSLGMASLLYSLPVSAQKPISTKTAANKSAKVKTMPADPAVRIGKLPNGLVYYIRKNEEPKKRAELYLANRIGSLMETDEQRGLAHFLEHMAFNGTADFPKNEIISYLQKAGVRFGADLNAYTGFNQTVYQLPIPTDSIGVFKTGFKILANWAGKISLNGTDIDAERGIIVEEDRQTGKNAQQRLQKQIVPVLLANSHYQHRLPIGDVELLQKFSHDKIRSFYADWYRPNLQAVIAVGDFDVDEVEELIKQNFSSLANPKAPKPRLAYSLPDNAQPLVVIATDKEQPYNVATVLYKHKEAAIKTDADYKKNFIRNMINAMLGTRLQEIIQKGNAPFLFAQSSYGPFQNGMVWGLNAWQTAVVAKSGKDLQAALTAALAENERMAKFGFTLPEFETVKKEFGASIERSHKEANKTKSSSYVQDYLNHFLTGEAFPAENYTYQLAQSILANVTLAEVNAMAKTLITPSNQVVIIQAPEKDKVDLPKKEQLVSILKTAGSNVKPYVADVVNKPLLAKAPVAGKIVNEAKDEKTGVTTLTLSNGIKVLLKPTTFKNDQIFFSSSAPGGQSVAPNAKLIPAQFAGVITESGVADYNPTQLNRYLAGKSVSVSPYIGEYSQGFSGFSAPADLETALQLVYAYATTPRKDTEIYNKNISDTKVVLANKNSSPSSVFTDTLTAVLGSYHQRIMPMAIADLQKASLDESFAFYQTLFADNSKQTFVFVGNFDVEKVKPLLATYLASLPVSGQPLSHIDNGVYPPKGQVVKNVYKGLEDKATVRLFWHGDYQYSQTANIDLQALKTALEIKVLERLREKESGVYSPGINLSIEMEPKPHYYISISFNCAKANVERLIAAAKEEVNSFVKNGATEEDLRKFRSEDIRQQELNVRENSYWLGYLAERIKRNEPLDLLNNRKALIEAVTPQKSKQAAALYLGTDNYIQMVLLPEK